MRIRVADHIANLLVKHSISHLFSITGGGAMHLNDAFGRIRPLPQFTITMNKLVPLQQRAMPDLRAK